MKNFITQVGLSAVLFSSVLFISPTSAYACANGMYSQPDGTCSIFPNGTPASALPTPPAPPIVTAPATTPIVVPPITPSGITGCASKQDNGTFLPVYSLQSGGCPDGTVHQTNGANDTQTSILITYRPLEPLPFIPQGGQANFCALLNGLLRLTIFLGGLMAVVSFVYSGIMYMTSAVVGTKAAAKMSLQTSVWGLLLLLGSYIILNTINPQLISCNQALNPVTNNSVVTIAGQPNYTQTQLDANLCSQGNGIFTIANPSNPNQNLDCPQGFFHFVGTIFKGTFTGSQPACQKMQTGICSSVIPTNGGGIGVAP
ncbi:MAG: hypothetical protein WCI89_00615 [bacterium]